MRSFRQFVCEMDTNMLSYGKDFAADVVSSDFDIEWWDERSKMKPWEVTNAENATTRRTHLLQWLKAASANSPNGVGDDSIPLTPKWQSRKR
jgi:hypothetical protein